MGPHILGRQACPCLLLFLVWMKLVWGESKNKGDGITFEEARADALANELDSGTELDDSQLDDQLSPVKENDDGTENDTSEKELDLEIVEDEDKVVGKEEGEETKLVDIETENKLDNKKESENKDIVEKDAMDKKVD